MLKWIRLLLLFIFLTTISCHSTPVKLPTRSAILYNDITFEVVYTGVKPAPAALEYLSNKIKFHKIARNVNFIVREVDCPWAYAPMHISLVKTFEHQFRTLHDQDTSDGHLIVFICYIPGPFTSWDDHSVAGLQYDKTSFAMFSWLIGEAEGQILLHEFGHLIEIATEKNRPKEKAANPKRPNHCNNKNCIMFWCVGGEDQNDFDSQCEKELEKLRRI